MAKSSAASETPSTTEQPPVAATTTDAKPPAMPAGFNDEGRPEIDGWLKAKEGLIVHGRICGYFSFVQRMRDGDKVREVICVKVYAPTPAALKGTEELITLQRGQVLAMSMMFCLEPLKAYVEAKGEVWVRFVKKTSIGGGQSVWKAEVGGKGEKKRLTAVPLQAPPKDYTGDGNEDSDSIPF